MNGYTTAQGITHDMTRKNAKPGITCRHCGRRIPLEWNGRAGKWMQKSLLLIQYDHEHRFCTVRCAVAFAIKAEKVLPNVKL